MLGIDRVDQCALRQGRIVLELLPAVVYREGKGWQAVAAFKPTFWSVLKIVTAFTVAHLITLTLATLGVISLPSRRSSSLHSITYFRCSASGAG